MIFHELPNIFFISPYGLFFAFSMAVFVLLSIKNAKAAKKEDIKSFLLFYIPISVLISRIIYVIIRRNVVLFDPVDGNFLGLLPIFEIYKGGLASFGYILSLVLTAFFFAKAKKLDFMKFLDGLAAPFALFFSMIKFDQFLAHQGYGLNLMEGFFPLAVKNNFDEWYIAVFLFEGLSYLLLFIGLLYKKSENKGFKLVFVISLMQMFFETLHQDEILRLESNNFIRIEMIFFFLFALFFVFVKYKKTKQAPRLLVDLLSMVLAIALIVLAEFHEKVPFPTLLLYTLSFTACVHAAFRLSCFKKSS